MKENSAEEGVVFVIDDDASCRAGLKELFESVGLKVRLYASDAISCLVLDVRLPESSGLKVQEELTRADIHMSIVFATGQGDIPMAVRALKAVAVDFLTKPVRSQDLLDAVFTALEQNRAQRATVAFNFTGAFWVAKCPRARSSRTGGGWRLE